MSRVEILIDRLWSGLRDEQRELLYDIRAEVRRLVAERDAAREALRMAAEGRPRD